MEELHRLRRQAHNQDILHPLATFNWEKISTGYEILSELMIYDGKVYAKECTWESLMCAPMNDLTSWTTLPLPYRDMTSFALTTYHSQLVLVGGRGNGKVLNEVWVSADGTNWQQSLPPMPTCRCEAVAVNTGSPECLVVAGGHYCDSVVVLVQGEWSSLPNLPHAFMDVHVRNGTTHSGNLYFWDAYSIYFCQVESLLAACTQTGADRETALWKRMSRPGGDISALVSFGQHLLAFALHNSNRWTCAAFAPLIQSWVHVADTINVNFSHVNKVQPISLKEMLVSSADEGLYKVTLRVSPYNPDSHFSTSALLRLEAVGIPVMTSLQNVSDNLAAAIGAGYRFILDDILKWWASGKTSPVPPTWRSLYGVLRELDLEELGQQIEDYLSSPRSLKEQCMSVIMSALLQQRPLEPDQLHVRLPDYVPPTVKQSLICTLKASMQRDPASPHRGGIKRRSCLAYLRGRGRPGDKANPAPLA